MEEANSGYSGCTGFEAGGGVLRGDAAEGVDGNKCGGGAGFVETVEASARSDLLAGDGFAEDRSEEDGCNGLGAGLFNLGEGVAGDGDYRVRQVG